MESRLRINNDCFGKKQNKSLIRKLLFFLVIFVLSVLLYISKIGCVWRYFFGIRCPGCGITHACIAFLKGDIRAAFEYNYMFVSLPVIAVYILFDGKVFRKKILDYAVLSTIFSGFLIHWICP